MNADKVKEICLKHIKIDWADEKDEAGGSQGSHKTGVFGGGNVDRRTGRK